MPKLEVSHEDLAVIRESLIENKHRLLESHLPQSKRNVPPGRLKRVERIQTILDDLPPSR